MKTFRMVIAAAALTMGLVVGSTASAGAWAWSPTVTLSGSANCKNAKATWVWVEASNGERGWATNGTGAYRFTFTRVPTSGMTVRVNFGTSTFSCTTSFGLNRPSVGTSATRNVTQVF